MRRGPRSTRTTRYSAKRRKGGLKRAATRTTKAPVATGYSRKGGMKTQYTMQQVSDTCVRITGRSYIGAVSNATTTGNSIGLLFDINPSLLGDRVAVLASTYDKYCYQNMKFTYVPQCPTSQPGSVMLVFERDPEAPAADTQGTNFMQEVMSYEHAVLTPAWVSTNVTYKRDPHEVKTWYMGGDQAALTARETSQGTFIAYTSNCNVNSSGANGNLGFVVMDFTLDLVSPNILPNRTASQGYQQWIHQGNMVFQEASGVTLTGNQYPQYFGVATASTGPTTSATGTLSITAAAGTIVEIILDGTNQTGLANVLNQLGLFQTGAVGLNSTKLASGCKIYATSVIQGTAVNAAGTSNNFFLLTPTLADAIALGGNVASTSAGGGGGTLLTVNSAFASRNQTGYYNLSITNAFYRVLIDGNKSASTA